MLLLDTYQLLPTPPPLGLSDPEDLDLALTGSETHPPPSETELVLTPHITCQGNLHLPCWYESLSAATAPNPGLNPE